MSPTRTILFLGTGGVGVSILRRSLSAGHTCVVLCRTLSKLQSLLAESEASHPNLTIEQGNAHDIDALLRCLTVRGKVDTIISSIGGLLSFATMALDDPHVCETGMVSLLTAISRYRAEGNLADYNPRIVAVSTTGVSEVARHIPVLMIPLYATLLKNPRKDKRAMEKVLISSDEKKWTIVRPSVFTDGPEAAPGMVREGVEDPVARVSDATAPGYTISRVDVGKWIFENLVGGEGGRYVRKAVMITY